MAQQKFEYVDRKAVPPELFCFMCKDPWVEPQQAACEHITCGTCMTKVLSNPTPKCPECSKPVSKKDLTKPVRALLNMVDRLEVFCSYKASQTCGWKGPRSDLAAHEAAEHLPKLPQPSKDIQYCNPDEVIPELKCSICLQPWTNPQQTPCEHIYCAKCIEPFVTKEYCCPDCRQPIKPTELRKPPRALLSMGDRLQVFCPFRDSANCVWKGDRGNLHDHCFTGHGVPKPTEQHTDPTVARPVATTAENTGLTFQTVNEYPSIEEGVNRKVVSMAHIGAPKLAAEGRRKPIRLVAVIDVSGSMKGAKLDLVKETLSFVVSEMESTDEVGIVTFNNNSVFALDLIKMTTANKNIAYYAISRLEARGGTNITAGIVDAFKLINSHLVTPVNVLAFPTKDGREYKPRRPPAAAGSARPAFNGVTSVWMFTDGQDGFGCNKEGVNNYMRSLGYNDTIFTFGFGSEHNADLLRGIAEVSQGSYYYIPDTKAVKPSFANCLGGLFSAVAQNIQLTLQLAPGVTVSKMMTKFPYTTIGPRTTSITMKDIYSEEQRDILIEFIIANTKANTVAPIAEWTLTYSNLISGITESKAAKSDITIHAAGAPVPAPNEAVVEQTQRVTVSTAMEEAMRIRHKEGAPAAKAFICKTRSSVASACVNVKSKHGQAQMQCYMDDMDSAMECLDEKVGAVAEMELNRMAMGHWQQRANCISSSNAYQTAAKCHMQEKCVTK